MQTTGPLWAQAGLTLAQKCLWRTIKSTYPFSDHTGHTHPGSPGSTRPMVRWAVGRNSAHRWPPSGVLCAAGTCSALHGGPRPRRSTRPGSHWKSRLELRLAVYKCFRRIPLLLFFFFLKYNAGWSCADLTGQGCGMADVAMSSTQYTCETTEK